MSEEYRDPVHQLEDQMKAADALIESLEGEVAGLRQDLERAGAALRASREEMSARGQALEDLDQSEQARTAAGEEVSALRAELAEQRQRSADEQLRLRNEHIAATAALRAQLEEQRRDEVASAEPEGKISALREEFRKERAAFEERHGEEIEELKRAAEQWEEKLRDGYRELEERHGTEMEELRREHAAEMEALEEAHRVEVEPLEEGRRDEVETLRRSHREEIEALRAETEGRKIELERTLREELGREREEQLRTERERHEAELQSFRSAAANRELELQKELRSAIEGSQTEVEELRLELERLATAAEERRNADLRDVKRLADARERELKRTQTTRLTEEKETAERRIAALKAQREADNNSWRELHAGELAKVRNDLEKRLAIEEERRKSEVATLEERLEGMGARRESETRLYGERLAELERRRLAEREATEKEFERRLIVVEEEKARLDDRLAELQDALEESGTLEAELREALGAPGEASGTHDEGDRQQDDGQVEPAADDFAGRLEEAEAARLLSEERAAGLEARLREAEEENLRRRRELEEALEGLKKVSDPARRLRAGISLFNESEHTRTVASISKALGLPKVQVSSSDGSPGSQANKPVLTFVWGEMAWRRYVSDPTQGVQEPRVYLIGTGDDPSEVRPDLEPNARMDARGRLILGVKAF